jgi:tetratricopeptide (TPR) repeat protein
MPLEELFEKAQIARNNGQTEEAVVAYLEAREKALNDQKGKKLKLATECLHMVGVTYLDSRDYDQAEEFLNKALEESRDNLKDNLLIGATLRDLGLLARVQQHLSKAKFYLRQSLDYLGEFKGHLGISQVKLGSVAAEEGNLEEAERMMEEGLENIKDSSDRYFEATGYLDLGKVYQKEGKKVEAKAAFEKSLEILNRISTVEEFQEMRTELLKQMVNFV